MAATPTSSFASELKLKKKWCPGPELNQRHCDFQSHALPTELPGRTRRRRLAPKRRWALIGGSGTGCKHLKATPALRAFAVTFPRPGPIRAGSMAVRESRPRRHHRRLARRHSRRRTIDPSRCRRSVWSKTGGRPRRSALCRSGRPAFYFRSSLADIAQCAALAHQSRSTSADFSQLYWIGKPSELSRLTTSVTGRPTTFVYEPTIRCTKQPARPWMA